MKTVVLGAVVLWLVFLPWGGGTTMCTDGSGPTTGCVSYFMNLFGMRYPEWLGDAFMAGFAILFAALIVWAFAVMGVPKKEEPPAEG